jgi:hypothetical protein
MPLAEHGRSLLIALRHRRSSSKDGPEETVSFLLSRFVARIIAVSRFV